MNKAQETNNPKPGPRLLPLKVAADQLGIATWALRQLIWSGDLPYVQFKPQGKMYLDSKDIEALIESNKRRMT